MRETVEADTPASRATSSTVTVGGAVLAALKAIGGGIFRGLRNDALMITFSRPVRLAGPATPPHLETSMPLVPTRTRRRRLALAPLALLAGGAFACTFEQAPAERAHSCARTLSRTINFGNML